MEINLGRGNANQQLCRFIWTLMSEGWEIGLEEINGGGLANAIPREAYAVILINPSQKEELKNRVKKFNDMLHAEYILAEGSDFSFECNELDSATNRIIDSKEAYILISAIYACPNGVQGMSNAVEGLVETSCNLASVKMSGEKIEITVHQRSSVDSRRDEIADRVKALFSIIGFNVEFDDAYVGWAPNPDSMVLKEAKESYVSLFGEEPKVEALHAGLECGLFLEKMPDLDMISFGPTLKDIHSPGEKAYIPSVEKFWNFLCDLLKRIAKS